MYLPLGRIWSKRVAVILILIGFLLASPPFIPSPDDWINFLIAGPIIQGVTELTYEQSVVISYFLGLIILIAGFMVYPYCTETLFKSFCKKIAVQLKMVIANPVYMIATVMVIVALYYIGLTYSIYVTQYVEGVVSSM